MKLLICAVLYNTCNFIINRNESFALIWGFRRKEQTEPIDFTFFEDFLKSVNQQTMWGFVFSCWKQACWKVLILQIQNYNIYFGWKSSNYHC